MFLHPENFWKELLPTIVAGIVIVIALLMLYFLIQDDKVSGDAGLAIISTVVGAAVSFIFQRQAIEQTARAVTNGAARAAVHYANQQEINQ